MNFKEDNTPPLAENLLIDLEQKIGHKLPQDYRDFLIRHNGGQPKDQVLRIPDCNDEVLVHHFLGIGRPNADIQKWLAEMSDDLDDHFLPIGFDPGGNALLMNMTDGKIYYWDSARFFSSSSDEENAFWVADSFSDLVERLNSSAIASDIIDE